MPDEKQIEIKNGDLQKGFAKGIDDLPESFIDSMPIYKSKTGITLEDVYKKLIEIEIKLDSLSPIAQGDIMKDEDSPFYDPEKKVFSIGYYHKNHPKDEGE